MQEFRMLIGGNLVDGAAAIEVVNPATSAPFAVAPRADAAQLEAAVAAAKAAFGAWAATALDQRRERLTVLAKALENDTDAFARLLTLEQGKPLPQAYGEVGGAVAALRAFAGMDVPLATLREGPEGRILRQRTPLGVTVAITPWNFPLLLLMAKVGPALLAGNTVVAKPAPTTPLTTLRFGELCAKALPAGVMNVIIDANDLGGALTAHPDVAKVAFTGSTATGRKVMASAAGTLKRLTLELGGNDPAIVLADADIAAVAPQIFLGATLASGQICLAIKRVYAPSTLYGDLCDALADLARRAVVGDGLDQGVDIGPVQNRMQFDKLTGYLDDARAHGRVLTGGRPLDRPGWFIPPTIVRDIADDTRLVREEQFGPVLPVLRYDDVDDAIARANDTDYGLGATIWTSDPERGLEVAMRLDAGAVWVNKFLETPFDIGFYGAKQSGVGAGLGPEGLAEFTQAKVINIGA